MAVLRYAPVLIPGLAAGCVPEFQEPEGHGVSLSLVLPVDPTPLTRIGAWQFDFGAFTFGAERESSVVEEREISWDLAQQPDDAVTGMGDLTPLYGRGVLLMVMVYEDLDGSGSHDLGEPITALGQQAPFQSETGAWYVLDLGADFVPNLGFTDVGFTFFDFMSPAPAAIGGGFADDMPPDYQLGLPADRVATLSPLDADPAAAAHRPADAPVDVESGAWSLELPGAVPGPYLGTRLVEIEGLGMLGLEIPVAYVDDGDDVFSPSPPDAEPPSFDAKTGVPDRDLVVGGLCFGDQDITLVYVPPPILPEAALGAWLVWRGQVGWHVVAGFGPPPEGEPPREPLSIPTSDRSMLDFRSTPCGD